MESIELSFPGDSRVEARYKGHTVLTAQPTHPGDPGVAPAPFDLFLVSIATCAGYYALRFCETREIPADDLRVSLEVERREGSKRVETLRIRVGLPAGFPAKYEPAIVRSIDQCAVKKHILEPPRFEVVTSPAAEQIAAR